MKTLSLYHRWSITFVLLSSILPFISAKAQTNRDTLAFQEDEVIGCFWPVSSVPTFPGGNDLFDPYLEEQVSELSIDSMLCDTVIHIEIEFTIETDGSVTKVECRNRSDVPEVIAIQFIELFTTMPKWEFEVEFEKRSPYHFAKSVNLLL